MVSDLDASLLAEAVSWLGTPYRIDGEDRHGVDCARFIGVVLRGCGIIASLPQIQTPPRFWTRPDFSIERSVQRTADAFLPPYRLVRCSPAAVAPGWFLGVSQLRRSDKITHMVMVESVEPWGGVNIIHAQAGVGVVRSRLVDAFRRIHAYEVVRLG